MGWWKVESSDDFIGDGPLDTLGAAVSDVVVQYQSKFGRKPTRQEWEAMLFAVLGSDESEFRPSDEGIVSKVSVAMDSVGVDPDRG